MPANYFVIRGSRQEPRMTAPATNRHMIIHAGSKEAALEIANKWKLAAEQMMVVGQSYF